MEPHFYSNRPCCLITGLLYIIYLLADAAPQELKKGPEVKSLHSNKIKFGLLGMHNFMPYILTVVLNRVKVSYSPKL